MLDEILARLRAPVPEYSHRRALGQEEATEEAAESESAYLRARRMKSSSSRHARAASTNASSDTSSISAKRLDET